MLESQKAAKGNLYTMDISKGIAVLIVDRKRMKAAKSWRIFMTIEEDGAKALASVFSSMIEEKLYCRIEAKELKVEIDPVFVEDVLTKSGRFHLVLETMYEHQAKEIAATLTSMVGESAKLFISQSNPKPVPGKGSGSVEKTPFEGSTKGFDKVSKDQLKGLHASFFKNEKFWEFVGEEHRQKKGLLHPIVISSEVECKSMFKLLAGVESCKDVEAIFFKETIQSFNDWINA